MLGREVATGTVEGTGATLNVQLGFKPKVVLLFNIDGLAKLEWTEDMGAGKGLKIVTAGTVSFISTLGIAQYAGVAAGNKEGFTIGADTDVNASGETICWAAFR